MSTQLAALEAALPRKLKQLGDATRRQQANKLAAAPGTGPHPQRWIPVRVLGPRHRRRILQHLLALEPADRQLRFGHVASDAQIERYVLSLDFFGRDELFGIFDRRLVLVALAHLALGDGGNLDNKSDDPMNSLSGEFGVSVASQARGNGFGWQLFEHTVTHARNRGAKRLVIYFDRSNAAMLAITRKASATVSFDGSQAMATVPLEPATLGTQVEAMVEAQAAEVDFQIKLQVQRLDRLWPQALKKTPINA